MLPVSESKKHTGVSVNQRKVQAPTTPGLDQTPLPVGPNQKLMALQSGVGNRALASRLGRSGVGAAPAVQRKPAAVQRAAGGIGLEGGELDQDTTRQIKQVQGGGKPLDKTVRREMESGFGRDFSGVRVHTGGKADKLNSSLNARAFTHGQDIFVRGDQANFGSKQGKQLLAHELTHTIQQTGGTVQRLFGWGSKKAESGNGEMMTWLTDQTKVGHFMEYAETEYNAENVKAWLAIRHFRKFPNIYDARALFDRYVSTSAPEQVNLGGKEVRVIEADLKQAEQGGQENVPSTLFDPALAPLETNMTDTFARFKTSGALDAAKEQTSGLKGLWNWRSNRAKTSTAKGKSQIKSAGADAFKGRLLMGNLREAGLA
jgi:hypothetical protein